MLEKYAVSKTKRIEAFGGELQRILGELTKRDLATIETPELYKLAIKLMETLREDAPAMSIQMEGKDEFGCNDTWTA